MKKNYTISIPAGQFWTIILPLAVLFIVVGGFTGVFLVDRFIMPQIVGVANRGIIEVPDILTIDYDEARQKLYDVGLRIQVTGREYNNSLAKGKVISQDPAKGEKVKKGRSICAQISEGPEVSILPSVRGFNERNARKSLRDAGFDNVSVRKYYDEVYLKDQVIGTEPPEGVQTSRAVTVEIKMSNGPRPTHADVPNIIGEMLSSARIQIEDNGLTVGQIEFRSSATAQPGSVISQSSPPGTSIPLGSSIDLVVAGNR